MQFEHFVRSFCTLNAALLLLVGGFRNTAAAPAVAPPKAQTYGKSLADWLKTYYSWTFGPNPSDNLVGKTFLLPGLQPGVPSGSGTIEDPLILSGEGAFAIKPGTSIYGTLIAFYGELYGDGTEDPVLPDDWWTKYVSGEIWLDGKRVQYDLADYYIPPQFYDPPIVYPEPTGIGSIATLFAQGNGFLLHPLSAGTHTLVLKAAVLAPEGNGVTPETAIIFHNTYTITVTR